jgi:ribose 5-phosphate isomerase RpiB
MNEQLVNQVVQRVLEAMGQGDGQAKTAATKAATVRAMQSSRPAARANGAAGPTAWLTAELFALRARGRQDVHLESHEKLTPAAADFAVVNGIEIKADAPAAPSGPAACADGACSAPALPGRLGAMLRTTGLVVHRGDLKVQAVLASLGRGGLPLRGYDASDCPLTNSRAMCQAIVVGDLAGGIIIDRYAAAPMVYAAKFGGIRPVQGVSTAAVEAALRQYQANVLVIGHADVSSYQIKGMIERFVAGAGIAVAGNSLTEAIEQLERGH